MELDLISPQDVPHVNKVLFNIRGAHDNGLVLQLHPSGINVHGERRKSRFSHCSFSENNLLAVTDNSGSTYVIDMEMEKYWQVPVLGTVSAISFLPLKKSQLMIAFTTGNIQIIHIESGIVCGSLNGHNIPVKNITYSHNGKYSLTSNSNEAIIWDLLSYSQAHKLSLKDNMLLKKALFMPVQDNIFACFQDDAINIWKFGTFECVKQIIPEGWKTHQLKCVAFTKNGRAMVIGGGNPSIAVFCLDTWVIKSIIDLPDSIHAIKYMKFLPQIFDGGANKILGLLTNGSEICFLDIESSLFYYKLPGFDILIDYFAVSPTGKYLADISVSGEAYVYITEKIFSVDETVPVHLQCTSPETKANLCVSVKERKLTKRWRQKWADELKTVHNVMREELTLKKLIPILKQFGEYPESYRLIIWRTILQLPMNLEAYTSLANKECHPSYINVESKYPLVNKALSNALKRVLSSLSYWCPLFGEVVYLPEFVFPFVKVFHLDPFVCFESIATIIVNWCQDWFEFYPFPPINVLSNVENLLAYHDPDLLEFYYKKNITCCLYACVLMQTAFSEVLNKREWLRLWDHILSNEPSFIFMAVIAYNIMCRKAIKNCQSSQNIEDLFHKQNAIDMKLFLSKCYHFLEKTPSDIHPRRYLSSFSPLEKGNTYSSYEAYPKLILDQNASRLQLIQKEEQEIIQEQRKTIAMRRDLDKKLKTDKRADFREEMLTELDEKFRQILNAEEERISAQRRKLRNLRHELKLKELAVLEEVREQILKKKSHKKEVEMKRLLKDIATRKERDKNELEAIEEEIHKYYSSMLLRKLQLKLDMEMSEENQTKNLSKELGQEEENLKNELVKLQEEITHAYDDKKFEIANKISNITDMLQQIETEIGQEVVGKDSKIQESKMKIESLWIETENLQKKVERLLEKDLMSRATSADQSKVPRHQTSKSYSSETKRENPEYLGKCSSRNLKLNNLGHSKRIVQKESSSARERLNSERREQSYRNSKLPPTRELRKGAMKLRSRFTECSKTTSPALSEESSSEYESNSPDSPTERKMCWGPRGDAEDQVLEPLQCRKDFTNPLCNTDSSSCCNESENYAVKMALSERQKLVQEAKECQLSSA